MPMPHLAQPGLFGTALAQKLGGQVPGLREMPDFSRPGLTVPRTPIALWCWLRAALPALVLDRVLDAFRHGDPQAGQDHAIGQHRNDNQELEDAPASAHVKRTAQESFSPQAFVLRCSMPWAQGQQCGLFFVAFGSTLDALFRFSRPVSGAYLWCPPMCQGRLDLGLLEL